MTFIYYIGFSLSLYSAVFIFNKIIILVISVCFSKTLRLSKSITICARGSRVGACYATRVLDHFLGLKICE